MAEVTSPQPFESQPEFIDWSVLEPEAVAAQSRILDLARLTLGGIGDILRAHREAIGGKP